MTAKVIVDDDHVVTRIEHDPFELKCVWCRQECEDGADVSGWTGEGADLMTDGGDFGCLWSPWTGEEGTGGHENRWNVARQIMREATR